MFSDGRIVNTIWDRNDKMAYRDITDNPDQAFFDKNGNSLKAEDPNWE